MSKNVDLTVVLIVLMMIVFMSVFGLIIAYDTYKKSELDKYAIDNRCEKIIDPIYKQQTYWGNCKK